MLVYGHGTTEPGNRINRRESFIRVRELGVDGVELDVRLNPDGELLVIYDPHYEDGSAVADTSSLDHIRNRRPDLGTAYLVLSRRPAKEVVRTCVEHGHRVIHPYISMVDETFMKMARDHDLEVNV